MNTEDLPSCQATKEDPTLPGAVAGEATIILTPENADAKLAFSEVADGSMSIQALLNCSPLESTPESTCGYLQVRLEMLRLRGSYGIL